MSRMARVTGSLIAALVVCTAMAPAALATPQDDFNAVKADYQPDGDVTSCRFTRAQLVNAYTVASQNPDFDSYTPGFRDEVKREIARWDSGGCAGKPAPVTVSPLKKLRIVKIRPRKGRSESVTIKNTGGKSVSLRGVTLRDRAGHRVKLGRGRLGAHRLLRAFTGCAKGRHRAVRRNGRLFACRRALVWNDGGDVVKIVDSAGSVVARRGYGRFRSVKRI